MAMAMARKTTMAMAMRALLLLVGVLSLLPCAAIADAEASMPALLAHIREIQRLSKAAHGEVEDLFNVDQPEQEDLVESLGAAESVREEDEVVEEGDPASKLFAHIYAVQRKAQEAAEEFERLNGEPVAVEGIVEDEEEERAVDPGEVVDALVQERFNQLEAALKILNDRDGVDNMQLSADGAKGDDAINLLHNFVQERQQKLHLDGADQESQLENDQSHEATVEHKGIGHGHRNNHGDRENLHGHDHQHGELSRVHDHRHGHHHHDHDAHANAGFSRVSDAYCHNHDHSGHNHGHQHGESVKKRKFVLPEEIAEEEDLLQYGFEGHKYSSAEHLSRLRGPELGVWLRAMGCSLLVSLASLICLMLLPCVVLNGKPSETVVNALASFGAGAMLGDAFLHQLPHAFGNSESPHSHDVQQHHHDHGHSHAHAHGHDHKLSAGQGHAHSLQDLSIGLAVLGGILLFFIVEKIVRRYEELSSHGGQRAQGHSHRHQKKKNKVKELASPEKIAAVEELGALEKESNSLETISSGIKKRKSGKKDTTSLGNVISTAPIQQVEASGEFVIGYLNLFSDAVHNFTDGMALGSAFLLHGTVGGWSRTLFLLAHELPQEVGDFGILVKSGFSVFEALAFNFLSALVTLAGTAMALMLGGSSGHSSLIEGFIAGGFIYMSTVGVISSMHDQGSSLTSTLSQLVPMVLGMGGAFVISLAE